MPRSSTASRSEYVVPMCGHGGVARIEAVGPVVSWLRRAGLRCFPGPAPTTGNRPSRPVTSASHVQYCQWIVDRVRRAPPQLHLCVYPRVRRVDRPVEHQGPCAAAAAERGRVPSAAGRLVVWQRSDRPESGAVRQVPRRPPVEHHTAEELRNQDKRAAAFARAMASVSGCTCHIPNRPYSSVGRPQGD